MFSFYLSSMWLVELPSGKPLTREEHTLRKEVLFRWYFVIKTQTVRVYQYLLLVLPTIKVPNTYENTTCVCGTSFTNYLIYINVHMSVP